MSDREEELSLEQAVRMLHRNKYRKAAAWTDVFSEFRTFTTVSNQQPVYFRLHETPTEFRYSEDSHGRVAAALSGMLASIEVEKIEQDFERTRFLLRSNHNYVSLREFLKIKSGNEEHTEMRFVLNVLNFLNGLIPVLAEEQILTELTLSSICFHNDAVRLCDYNLLFYPRNRRADVEGLEQKYLKQAGYVIFELLSLKMPSKMEEIYRIQIKSLLDQLTEKDSSSSAELFISVVGTLLNDGVINQKELKTLTKKIIYESSSMLTQSNLTVKDERTISTALSKNPTRNSSVASVVTPVKPKISRKRRIVCASLCLLMLIGAVATVLMLFIFNEKTCRPNEYYADHRCNPCYDGCKNCEGALNDQCTKCWGSLWLVKLNNQQRTGKCESQCIGQEYEGRECIMMPAEADPSQ